MGVTNNGAWNVVKIRKVVKSHVNNLHKWEKIMLFSLLYLAQWYHGQHACLRHILRTLTLLFLWLLEQNAVGNGHIRACCTYSSYYLCLTRANSFRNHRKEYRNEMLVTDRRVADGTCF